MRTFSTPMMQQFMEIKQQYPDCLLFFRLGDFYELFLDDAVVGAKILDIVLTKRPRGKDGEIPMAGVPFHAADGYIAKLVKAGHKVAICEQLSEPDKKGIVERGVVRIVTPGTILDEKTLDEKEHNYTVAIAFGKETIGLAIADLSTGDFSVTEFDQATDGSQQLMDELSRTDPQECILSHADYEKNELLQLLAKRRHMNIYAYENWDAYAQDAQAVLTKQLHVKSLEAFGIQHLHKAQEAAAALLGYLQYTQQNSLSHLQTIRLLDTSNTIMLDQATVRNLELFSTLRDREDRGTLIEVLDNTHTAMGGRMLRNWLKRPLREIRAINERLDIVEIFFTQRQLHSQLTQQLKPIYDIERILSRLSVGIGNAYDVVNLKQSLIHGVAIRDILAEKQTPLFDELQKAARTHVESVIDLIDKTIVDDPPFDLRNGGLIKKGIDKKLDTFRQSVSKDTSWIAQLEKTQREETGIASLKIKFNKVFGYYIEVSKANLHLVPETYVRKQTMVNAERFITAELKEYEDRVLHGQSIAFAIEYELFLKTVDEIVSQTLAIQSFAEVLAKVDCLLSLAQVARDKRYIKPVMTEENGMSIEAGRHPVVEQVRHEPFVPNSISLDQNTHQLLVITGPNMAGKSVFMRQVALIVLLAHIGSYVPATQATINVVDHIFVRSGASDVIASGMSTFMVEMVETAHILRHATDKSLVIMDEIGRGTSTYDGISIAWAVAEYLVTHKGTRAKTLFATHYHELQALEDAYPEQISNYHMAVAERKGEPVFLHTLMKGRAAHSYAVAVAKLAGVPEKVTTKAQTLLESLEQRTISPQTDNAVPTQTAPQEKRDTEIMQQLTKANIDAMTPLEALTLLAELRKKATYGENK